jgi:hypothetical protein
MLLFLIVEYFKVGRWGIPSWHNVHINFVKCGLPGLEVKMGKCTHRQHDDQKRNFFLFMLDISATG